MAKNVYSVVSEEKKTKKAAVQRINLNFLRILKIPEFNRKNTKFGFFIFCLLMLSIFIHHNHISIMKQITDAQRERNGARASFLNLKSEHEIQQRQSEVAKKLDELGSDVQIVKTPPIKIMVRSKR